MNSIKTKVPEPDYIGFKVESPKLITGHFYAKVIGGKNGNIDSMNQLLENTDELILALNNYKEKIKLQILEQELKDKYEKDFYTL